MHMSELLDPHFFQTNKEYSRAQRIFQSVQMCVCVCGDDNNTNKSSVAAWCLWRKFACKWNQLLNFGIYFIGRNCFGFVALSLSHTHSHISPFRGFCSHTQYEFYLISRSLLISSFIGMHSFFSLTSASSTESECHITSRVMHTHSHAHTPKKFLSFGTIQQHLTTNDMQHSLTHSLRSHTLIYHHSRRSTRKIAIYGSLVCVLRVLLIKIASMFK